MSQPKLVPTCTAWWTEARACKQLAQGCYVVAHRPRGEPATFRSRIRRPTTEPPLSRLPYSRISCWLFCKKTNHCQYHRWCQGGHACVDSYLGAYQLELDVLYVRTWLSSYLSDSGLLRPGLLSSEALAYMDAVVSLLKQQPPVLTGSKSASKLQKKHHNQRRQFSIIFCSLSA